MNRRQMRARAANALAAWNRGDPEGIVVNVAEDVIWRDVALGMPLHGREALKAAAQAYMTAFPDLHIEETSSTLAVPRLAQELTITGTQRGGSGGEHEDRAREDRVAVAGRERLQPVGLRGRERIPGARGGDRREDR